MEKLAGFLLLFTSLEIFWTVKYNAYTEECMKQKWKKLNDLSLSEYTWNFPQVQNQKTVSTQKAPSCSFLITNTFLLSHPLQKGNHYANSYGNPFLAFLYSFNHLNIQPQAL